MSFPWNITEKKVKTFIDQWSIDQSSWLGLSVNTTNYKNTHTNLQIESLYGNDQNMIQWGKESENKSHLSLIKNTKVFKSGGVGAKDHIGIETLIHSVMHLHLIRSRELLINWAKSRGNQNLETQSIPKINEEEKTLEWIKVSFVVLKKALDQVLQDPTSTIQYMLFCGKQPQQPFRFKLRLYNLDIEFIENDHRQVFLSVYDKKQADTFQPEHLVLKGSIHQLINPIVDEMIKLLPYLEMITKVKNG